MPSKVKISIALDEDLLRLVDARVDDATLSSRSQAISFFLRKGMMEFMVEKAVILVSKEHQELLLRKVRGKTLLEHHLCFLEKNKIKEIILLTQASPWVKMLERELRPRGRVVELDIPGTAQILWHIKEHLEGGSFLVMSGDTLLDIDLGQMIKKHAKADKLATIGLMSREKPMEYGSVVLDDDLVIAFKEKSTTANSYVVNAGIYLFKPEIFALIDRHTTSLEKDLFPKLAKSKQMIGSFIYGMYEHLG
ncbi:hypothetical protein HZB02_03760 [Candidatus Woesearchaeota archaeon]|nr:hypothetical protein [Candidatus Woesearchaeota archaeon]